MGKSTWPLVWWWVLYNIKYVVHKKIGKLDFTKTKYCALQKTLLREWKQVVSVKGFVYKIY